jgi:hypothetical protein
MKIKIGGIYQHYKNKNYYKVIALAKDSESLKDMVVYEAQYDNPLSKHFVRPYSEWSEEVKDVEGNVVHRFTYVKDDEESPNP